MRTISVLVERIDSLLISKNLKVKELEDIIGAGNGTIRSWMKSEDPNPKLDKLCKIANYFGTTVAYLIGETDSPGNGKLILQNESNIWDRFLPLTENELQWIEAMRFLQARSPKPMTDEEVERKVNMELDKQ